MANNYYDADHLDAAKDIKRISQSDCDLVYGYFHQERNRRNYIDVPAEIINICLLFAFRLLFDSSILTSTECLDLHKLIEKRPKWKLLYRGSRDGYKVEDCHPKCYSKPNVLLLIESKKGNVFGGFSHVGWLYNSRPHKYKKDKDAFLFLLRAKSHNHKIRERRFNIKTENIKHAIYHYNAHNNAWLFCFGKGGCDLCVAENCHQNNYSGSRIKCFQSDDKYILNRGDNFSVKDIEVFQLS